MWSQCYSLPCECTIIKIPLENSTYSSDGEIFLYPKEVKRILNCNCDTNTPKANISNTSGTNSIHYDVQIFVHQMNNTTVPEKEEKRCLTYDSCDIHQDVKKIKVEEEQIHMYGHGDNSIFCSVDQMSNTRVSGKGVKRCLTCDTCDTKLNVKKIRVETEHMDTNGHGGNSGFGSNSIVGSQPTQTKNSGCVCTCCHTKNLER